MSLSFRLNLLIVFTFVLILLPSTVLIIINTREAVSKELESSAELALQLLTAATLSGSADNAHQWRQSLLSNLNRLSKIRHLNIAIIGVDDKPIMPVFGAGDRSDAIVPRWFSGLVAPASREFRQRISSSGLSYTEIIFRPDPTDEIIEAWRETGLLLDLILLLVLLVIGLVFLVINRALRPIRQILAALFVERALKAGARGYITKNSAPDTLVEAVKVVSSGNLFLDHELAQRIALEKAYGRDGLFGVLSTREFEIFRLIGEGLSTAEVSHRLNLSNKTISNYATQIKNKLKVQSKSELIRLAIRHGVVEV